MAKSFFAEVWEEISPVCHYVLNFLILMVGGAILAGFCIWAMTRPTLVWIVPYCEKLETLYTMAAFAILTAKIFVTVTKRTISTLKRCFGTGSNPPMHESPHAEAFQMRLLASHVIIATTMLLAVVIFHYATDFYASFFRTHAATMLRLHNIGAVTVLFVIGSIAINVLAEVTAMVLRMARL